MAKVPMTNGVLCIHDLKIYMLVSDLGLGAGVPISLIGIRGSLPGGIRQLLNCITTHVNPYIKTAVSCSDLPGG